MKVNGTSIQAAIDAAPAGETIDIAAGRYAGFRNSKMLAFRGDGVIIEGPGNTVEHTSGATGSSMIGDMTIQGATGRHGANVLVRANDILLEGLTLADNEAGHGVRCYQVDRTIMRDITIHDVPFGVQFNGKASGSILEDFTMYALNRMIVDDETPGNDTGATGIDFFRTVGPTIVRHGTMKELRSKHSYDYVRDGGAIAAYGGARNATIENLFIEDALNVFEDGKGAADPDNANFVFRRIAATGRPGALGTGKENVCQGVLVRSMQGFIWEDFDFLDLDGFGNFLFDRSGNYAGGLSGVDLKGRMILKPGVTAYRFNHNVPLGAVKMNNQVTFRDAAAKIAEVAGKGITNRLDEFKSWGAQVGTSERWAPQVVTPPNPCAAVEAELKTTKAELLLLKAAHDKLASKVSRANAVLDE